jgi:hypothetical protein
VDACGSNEPLRVSVAAKLGYMRGYMRGPWYDMQSHNSDY